MTAVSKGTLVSCIRRSGRAWVIAKTQRRSFSTNEKDWEKGGGGGGGRYGVEQLFPLW